MKGKISKRLDLILRDKEAKKQLELALDKGTGVVQFQGEVYHLKKVK